jgi:hypothetical protein
VTNVNQGGKKAAHISKSQPREGREKKGKIKKRGNEEKKKKKKDWGGPDPFDDSGQ